MVGMGKTIWWATSIARRRHVCDHCGGWIHDGEEYSTFRCENRVRWAHAACESVAHLVMWKRDEEYMTLLMDVVRDQSLEKMLGRLWTLAKAVVHMGRCRGGPWIDRYDRAYMEAR